MKQGGLWVLRTSLNINYYLWNVVMLYSIRDLVNELKISKSQIYQMVSIGEFPKPKKLGRLSRWRREDIEAFVRSKLA